VEVLARAGVRRFYTVPGESFLEILDAVEQHPELSLVSTRHESGASFMAEADAKLTGVPAAVAAKLAAFERPVVACCGDGGFLMTGQEIETAVRCGTPILVVVFRNGMHGTIAMHQAREVGRTAGVEIGEVDLAGYARSLGAAGYTVREPEDLAPVLADALASGSVALVDVVTDPSIISPSARLSEL
jgi:acetolactate synthase-1/2/3 large subunit